ncbi:hypothetical protein GCM10007862_01540 [Dyella lipolytica]|nr:hypothetical protein GCM10007862_01540 [Dyella lipolytica]
MVGAVARGLAIDAGSDDGIGLANLRASERTALQKGGQQYCDKKTAAQSHSHMITAA